MISKSHPRYASLKKRELLEHGVRDGITSFNGLIAHGRGEAFDYLLGEKTHDFAMDAIIAAAILLRQAKHPVISVNGNTAVLVPEELVQLSDVLRAPLEVNLFHPSTKRFLAIRKHLKSFGAKRVLLPEERYVIKHLDSERKYVNHEGINSADAVFVPLEDGDRTEALLKSGKKVITVDLNPLSRTAQSATITIVDNVTRALPLLLKKIKTISDSAETLWNQRDNFDNARILMEAENMIRSVTD